VTIRDRPIWRFEADTDISADNQYF